MANPGGSPTPFSSTIAPSSDDGGSTYLWLLILPVLTALMAILLAVYVSCRLYNRNHVTGDSNNSLVSDDTGPGVFCDSLLVEGLIQDNPHYIIAQAQFSASTSGTRRAAAKILKQTASEAERLFFLHEVQAMRSMPPHNHVLRAVHTATDTDPSFLLVEFPPGGVLIDLLRDMRASVRREEPDVCHVMALDLLGFSVQIARGMNHLSSLQILHRDLAARSVLLGINNTCKITNFASAVNVRHLHATETKTGVARPWRWLAPECLSLDSFTSQSDVWSFGILLWEIITLGGTPYPGATKNDVMIDVPKGYVMTQPLHCSFELYVIMSRCWVHKASDRASFGQLSDFLLCLTVGPSLHLHLNKYTPATFPVMKCDRHLEIV